MKRLWVILATAGALLVAVATYKLVGSADDELTKADSNDLRSSDQAELPVVRELGAEEPLLARLNDPAKQQRGKLLAAEICATCHLLPTPDLLPRAEWRVVLTYMAFFLGQELERGDDGRHYSEYQPPKTPVSGAPSTPSGFSAEDVGERYFNLAMLGLVPSKPTMSDDDWESIRAYFEGNAPDALPPPRRGAITAPVEFFDARPNRYLRSANTTMVHIDEKAHEIYVGDMGGHKGRPPRVVVFSPAGVAKREFEPGGVPISVTTIDDGFLLSLIGDFFPNTRNRFPAKILRYDNAISGPPAEELRDLPRLANTVFADLNGDGELDALTCGHGHGLIKIGNVALYIRNNAGFEPPQVLVEYPGCVRVEVADVNGDKRPDVVALMAGAREGLVLLINQGNGEFLRREAATRHSAFGYVHLQLADFDGDGDIDFLTVNGDNQDGDRQNRVRPYHGVRIYLNDGSGQFREAFFFYLHGAMMAQTRDYDRDGDLDIAVISAYPRNYEQGGSSFVYLENRGNLEFVPRTHKANHMGRWMVMDAGDADGDGDIDIVLGGFSFPVGLVGNVRTHTEKGFSPAFLILENNLAQP